MAFYATSMIPLSAKPKDIKGIFYADDGSGGGKLVNLKEWWSRLKVDGPPLGYFPYPEKTWLITKPAHKAQAEELFPDVKITVTGRKFLGSFIGTPESHRREGGRMWQKVEKDQLFQR